MRRWSQSWGCHGSIISFHILCWHCLSSSRYLCCDRLLGGWEAEASTVREKVMNAPTPSMMSIGRANKPLCQLQLSATAIPFKLSCFELGYHSFMLSFFEARGSEFAQEPHSQPTGSGSSSNVCSCVQ